MKSTLLALFLFCSAASFSQRGAIIDSSVVQRDSILLLNGKVLHGNVLGLEKTPGDSILKYETIRKDGSSRPEIIQTYRVFHFVDEGNTRVLYRQDEFLGNYLSVSDTRDVTYGSYDARRTFKPHVPTWTSFALGFGASIFDTYLTNKQANDPDLIEPKTPGFFKGNPSIFPFLVPVVVSVSWGLPSFRLKEKNMIHKQYLHNENYYRGYHRIAKQKRMLGALLGSLGGIATGMIIHYSVQ